MKPFLGMDITNDRKNEEPNGEELIVARTSEAMADALERSSFEAGDMLESSRLKAPFRVIKGICGIVAALVIVGIIRGVGRNDDITLMQAYSNAPWLFWVGGAALVIWAVLSLIGNKKEKSVLETDNAERVVSRLEGVAEAVYTELGVPTDAKDADIFSFFYKDVDGEIKVKEKGLQMAPYINGEYKVFADDENLYIADLERKYAIPLSSMTAIREVKKHIRMTDWNKDEPYNKGIYKMYKLTSDNYDCVHSKYYYILEFKAEGETWGIYIPCYELPVFENLTGLRAQ